MRLVSVAFVISTLALAVAGCAEDGKDFEDVPDEPALDQQEQALLPTGTEAEHLADLDALLAAEMPENDAARFDDDVTVGIIDEVISARNAVDRSAPITAVR